MIFPNNTFNTLYHRYHAVQDNGLLHINKKCLFDMIDGLAILPKQGPQTSEEQLHKLASSNDTAIPSMTSDTVHIFSENTDIVNAFTDNDTCLRIWLFIELLRTPPKEKYPNPHSFNRLLIEYRMHRGIKHPSLFDKFRIIYQCIELCTNNGYRPDIALENVIRVILESTNENDHPQILNYTDSQHDPLLTHFISQNYPLDTALPIINKLILSSADVSIPSKKLDNKYDLPSNEYPLHRAVKINSIGIVECLIFYDADCNVKSLLGNTPFYDAVELDHKKIVIFLVSVGANILTTCSTMQTPLFLVGKKSIENYTVEPYEDILLLYLIRQYINASLPYVKISLDNHINLFLKMIADLQQNENQSQPITESHMNYLNWLQGKLRDLSKQLQMSPTSTDHLLDSNQILSQDNSNTQISITTDNNLNPIKNKKSHKNKHKKHHKPTITTPLNIDINTDINIVKNTNNLPIQTQDTPIENNSSKINSIKSEEETHRIQKKHHKLDLLITELRALPQDHPDTNMLTQRLINFQNHPNQTIKDKATEAYHELCINLSADQAIVLSPTTVINLPHSPENIHDEIASVNKRVIKDQIKSQKKLEKVEKLIHTINTPSQDETSYWHALQHISIFKNHNDPAIREKAQSALQSWEKTCKNTVVGTLNNICDQVTQNTMRPNCYPTDLRNDIFALLEKLSNYFPEKFPVEFYIFGSAHYKEWPNDIDLLAIPSPNWKNQDTLVKTLTRFVHINNGKKSEPYRRKLSADLDILILKAEFSINEFCLNIDINILQSNHTLEDHAKHIDIRAGRRYYCLKSKTSYGTASTLSDIANKTLELTGPALDLLTNDPGRILRIVRTMLDLPNWHISPSIDSAIKFITNGTENPFDFKALGKTPKNAADRLYDEIRKIFKPGRAIQAFTILQNLNLLSRLFGFLSPQGANTLYLVLRFLDEKANQIIWAPTEQLSRLRALSISNQSSPSAINMSIYNKNPKPQKILVYPSLLCYAAYQERLPLHITPTLKVIQSFAYPGINIEFEEQQYNHIGLNSKNIHCHNLRLLQAIIFEATAQTNRTQVVTPSSH